MRAESAKIQEIIGQLRVDYAEAFKMEELEIGVLKGQN